jgi:hypothetical protein
MKHSCKSSVLGLALAAVGLATSSVSAFSAAKPVNVTQFHNNPSRDGLFIDAAFTPQAAANLKRDTNFDGTIAGHVYAQPLYIEGGPGGKAMVIAVTESNNVYALDATNGSIIWQRNVGAPAPDRSLPCGNVHPLGITGTPVVDLPSRALFFDAMTTPDGGTTKQHLIYSLNVDTGNINSGWPVDVNTVSTSDGLIFNSSVQNERAALGIVGKTLYVPYGGHYGDCGNYRGWVVGVRIDNPKTVVAWATPMKGGGIWGVGGIASDGKDIFVVTGNTFGAKEWGGGEAVIRLQPGPVFSGATKDYWAPTNWKALDQGDTDLGGSGSILIDVPGATPSALVLALGKDCKAYLLDRSNFGGVGEPLTSTLVSRSQIVQAAVTYRTSRGTYVVFRGTGDSTLIAFRIEASKPPTITPAWSVTQSGRGSPFVTSTDGKNNMIVWAVGAEGSRRLNGYNGDTGEVVYAGGETNEELKDVRRFNTGIVAHGRIYVAGDDKVYAFAISK